jgi:hypothetical protein
MFDLTDINKELDNITVFNSARTFDESKIRDVSINNLFMYKTNENQICINDITYTCSNATCGCNRLYNMSCYWCLFDSGFLSIKFNLYNDSYYFDMFNYNENIDLTYTPFNFLKTIVYTPTHISDINDLHWHTCIFNEPDMMLEYIDFYDSNETPFKHMNVWMYDDDIICMNYNNAILCSKFEHRCNVNRCHLCDFKNKQVIFDANPFHFTKSRWIYLDYE